VQPGLYKVSAAVASQLLQPPPAKDRSCDAFAGRRTAVSTFFSVMWRSGDRLEESITVPSTALENCAAAGGQSKKQTITSREKKRVAFVGTL